ncbi:MAG: hypothetical protein JXB47_09470 [Anaerolineae bacterium]|nr:hypothetical protein [Anaerolineae bacterium]
MSSFPRTMVGGVSLSRLIIGTNWFLGFSHTTPAKDHLIKSHMDRSAIADVIEVFFRAGVDTIMGPSWVPLLREAIAEAEDRTGTSAIVVATPMFPVSPQTPVDGFDPDEVKRVLDETATFKPAFCMPHQATTDAMVDRCTRSIRKMDQLCRLIRERDMIPGLSTHMPEAIIYADETGLDIAMYISIYNAMGFLMQIEVDWIARMIQKAQKPVMTIKPMAAGQLRPFQALNFVWNTIREQDMVTVGCLSPREAQEVIDLSLDILARRPASLPLQETRSKASVKAVSS